MQEFDAEWIGFDLRGELRKGFVVRCTTAEQSGKTVERQSFPHKETHLGSGASSHVDRPVRSSIHLGLGHVPILERHIREQRVRCQLSIRLEHDRMRPRPRDGQIQ